MPKRVLDNLLDGFHAWPTAVGKKLIVAQSSVENTGLWHAALRHAADNNSAVLGGTSRLRMEFASRLGVDGKAVSGSNFFMSIGKTGTRKTTVDHNVFAPSF